jgi:hypothetical protein
VKLVKGTKVYVRYKYAPNGLIEAIIIRGSVGFRDIIFLESLNYTIPGGRISMSVGSSEISIDDNKITCTIDLILPYGKASVVLYGTKDQ